MARTPIKDRKGRIIGWSDTAGAGKRTTTPAAPDAGRIERQRKLAEQRTAAAARKRKQQESKRSQAELQRYGFAGAQRRELARREARQRAEIGRQNIRAPKARAAPKPTRPERISASILGKAKVSPFGKRLITDLINAAYYAPGGVYELGKGVGKDVFALTARGDPRLKYTRRFGKAIVKGTAEDIRHPLRHPGYTGLDVLGLAAGGAGAVSRGAAATRALKAGEGVRRAVTRPGYEGGSLLRKPIAGETELKVGGKPVAHRLEHDVALLRPLHRARTRRLQKRLDQPVRERAATAPGRAWQDYAAAENVVGREIRAARRIEADVAKAPAERVRRGAKKLSKDEQTALRLVAIEGNRALQYPEEVAARHAAQHSRWAEEGIEPHLNREIAKDIARAGDVLRRKDPAFLREVAATRRLSRQGEQQALARGFLTPESAEGSRATLARTYGHPAEGAPKGSFYFPTGERFKLPSREMKGGAYSPRPGETGMGPPEAGRYAKGTFKRRTGVSFRRGVVEKPGAAVAEAFTGRQRLYSAKDLHEQMRAVGSPTRQSEFQIPIRLKRGISPELRRTVETELERARTGDESAFVRAKDALERELRADEHLKAPLGAKVKNVVWVDRRFLKEIETGPQGAVAKVLKGANKPFRLFGVYLRPAYLATNYPANVAMGGMVQGRKIGGNMVRGHRARKLYGEENTNWLDSAAGVTRTESYQPRGAVRGIEEAAVGGITTVTDRAFRRASVIYRAQEKGYKGKAGLERLRTSTDPKVVAERNAIIRRARKDAVDFDSLTPAERQLVEGIYFYPWISRASAWTGRAVLNRPIKSAALAQGARVAQAEQEDVLGAVPSWMKGYISSRFGLSNPSPLNAPQTPAQIGEFFLHPRRDTSIAEEFGTPALELASAGDLKQRLRQMIGSTGIGGIARRAGVAPEIVGEPSKTFPKTSPLRALGPFLAGGPFPREADREVMRKQAIQDLPPLERIKVRHDDYGQEILKGARQTGLLAKDAPLTPQLTRALKERRSRYENRERLGAEDTRSRFAADVQFLQQRKLIDAAKARKATDWAQAEKRDYLVERELRRLSDWYFDDLYGDALADARQKLREKGYDLPRAPR